MQMQRKTRAWTALLALGALVLLARGAGAQTLGDPCVGAPTAPQEVPSGAPFKLTWSMAQQVPKGPGDPTMVPHRYSGFALGLDGGPRQEIGLPASVRSCPNGTARAGDLVYEYQVTGVTRGPHTYGIEAWNHPYLKNPDGSFQTNPDGTPKEDMDPAHKQYGQLVQVPFVAVDVTDPASGSLVGPPYGAFNVWILRPAATRTPVKKD